MRWTNFRGYERSPFIEFPALTLLIGRNNAGKTSAYAPLLLLRQTLDAQNPETALLFRGSLVDFGSYRDVVTDHDVSRKLAMRLDFGAVYPALSGSESHNARSVEVEFGASSEHPAELVRSTIRDSEDKVLVSRTRRAAGGYKVFSPMLPKNTEVGRPYKEVTQLRQAMESEEPEGFQFSGVSGIHLPRKWRQDQDRWEKVQGWYRASSDLFELYFSVNRTVERDLENISYLGPLRSAPQRAYLLSAEAPGDVGRDGERAPEVLYQSRLHDSDVLERTNEWVERLGYGTLDFESLGDYFRVLVTKPGSSIQVNLADCGVGLSQLLPLLVQGCVMGPGDTLIAQQPEIHLNPAQQDVLTDFLVSLAQSGRRVVIETHSEHVLGRLRRRVAEGETLPAADVALYFCESDDGRSSIRRIEIGEYGEVSAETWPAGFFGEQLENSMRMALAQARRRPSR